MADDKTNLDRPLRLFLVPSPSSGVSLPVIEVGEEVALGRHHKNDVVILDTRVSKYHARVFRRRDDYCLEDLNSLNGTRLNDAPLPRDRAVALRDGDVIGLGGVALTACFRRMRNDVSAPAACPPAQARQRFETPRDLMLALSDAQRRFVSEVEGGADEAAVRRYASRYLANPLAAVRRQNHAVWRWLGWDARASAGPDLWPPPDLPREMLVLSARIEQLARREAAAARDVGPDTYEEMHGVEFIFHGDLLPSHMARLDDSATFHLRELLVCHKCRTELEDLLVWGRSVGVVHRRDIIAGRAKEAAVMIFRTCVESYPPLQAPEDDAGEMRTLGHYLREGSSCRHRSAGLQLMLQEAGIRSRYVRGLLMASGPHAWVEAATGRTGEFDLALDPNFGVYGVKRRHDPIRASDGRELEVFGLADAAALGDTDPKGLGYMVDPADRIMVWRPHGRPPGVSDESVG